jgi:hypothetical protein
VARGHLNLIHRAEGEAIGVKDLRLADLAHAWQRVAGQVLDIHKV